MGLLSKEQTTESIVATFLNTIDKLEKHSDNQASRANVVEEQIVSLTLKKTDLQVDSAKAKTIATKLRAVFN